MSSGNTLKASELAELLKKELSKWNVAAGDDCSKALANVCFDYIGPKLEAQLQDSCGCFETIRD